MNNNFLEKIKEKLEKEKQAIEKQLKGFAGKNKKIKGDWNTDYPRFENSASDSLEEAADEVEEYSNLLPVEHNLELKLVEINKALERVKKGEYGVCEKCGKEIDPKRLEVSPEVKICTNCGQ